jgi:4-amino-4-deoxy-L-arabinose transferase-like glycosyltransferase
MISEQDRHGYRMTWALFAVATLSSLPALGLYFIGEEGILAVTSMEMWYRGDWLHLWIFGKDLNHGTFANWLIIPVSALVGWGNVLPVTRAIMILSTAAAGGMVFFLTQRLYRDRGFAVFAAVVYVTFADVLFYRGWLGYRDPLFGCLVFSSVASLWIAAKENRWGWLAVSWALVTLAFLTKGLTAYVFYGTAAFVLVFQPRERAFLLRPASIFLALLGVAVLVLWLEVALSGSGQTARMTTEIMSKLSLEGADAYVLKLATYPMEVLVRLAPASLLALWWGYRQRATGGPYTTDTTLRTAAAIAFLGLVPYWFAPHSHIRYLAPVLPLFAMVIAMVIWKCGAQRVATTMKWLWAAVALKFIVVLVVFPLYQQHYRGENYVAAARDIVARTEGHPLYTTNASASGLSVAANLNILRLPAPPVAWPPPKWDTGFVISYTPDPGLGRLVEQYRLGGNDLYLLCRGAACDPR